MARSTPILLRATAGPRIRAARPRELEDRGVELPSLSDLALRHERGDGTRVIALLREELGRSGAELLPWRMPTPDPARRIGLLAITATALTMASVAAGFSPIISALPALLAGTFAWVVHRGDDRRAHQISMNLDARLREDVPLVEMEEEIEDLLQLSPEHDGARFLLAILRLQRGEALAALMQLAPLRDRHPDSGEIVIVAALAYASLEMNGDALRMLEALSVDPNHPWREWVARLYAACRGATNSGTRASSGSRNGLEVWPED